ncbi:response regulator [Psychrosphaera aquimarina]|jgi:two-component system chemotaxis response regulator CheY|uniref:Response regulator n=1 Tax=Psychrosphaera aquimarina TaxID=2044854 RepID=A0ABU3QZD1_9GAMM|nr:response regulator [Psychrosphaera aquimarina]MDU0112777.1 response regulator [Psychrosphaera aquimarina]
MSDLSSLSYLIVDDVSSVRVFLRQTLVHMEVTEIYEASCGADALDAFKQHIPDVVFLDIELPDSDGQEILKQIRSIKSNAFVVMVSAHSTVDIVKYSLSHGAAGFIVKPFSPKKITTILKKFQG